MATTISRRSFTLSAACACAAGGLLADDPAAAQQAPPFATREIAPGLYVFRCQGHQAMFVATPEGVIATDPIGLRRPQAVTTYIEEIRKVSPAPIRYLAYSHHRFDHIAGGKPFKDAGATVVAHHRARDRLARLGNPGVVPVDEAVPDGGRAIELGGTRLELHYVGRNHSDNSLVMRLPQHRLIFAVDRIPIESVGFRNMPDSCLPDWLEGLDRVLAMEWDHLLPGHPNAGGRLGTREDVRNFKQCLLDVSEAARRMAQEGKCFDQAMHEVRLPRYERWTMYEARLPGNVERFCGFWNNGI
ncbi:MBL fold metallo-hydrolase [Caldovatus aquaticus]|uniref:MBL fold metallo-hydrolase n=1 Tax=Caldovatus aquaticus TaxID=2865671 RepID=A0ABS7F0U8_9PROT|nr:MBL fold metallo-hydrolase [Caldovatus aquaticus]MBW8269138.1 MBL fold metallo-hydrolase [Caldovatus aquaticus]